MGSWKTSEVISTFITVEAGDLGVIQAGTKAYGEDRIINCVTLSNIVLAMPLPFNAERRFHASDSPRLFHIA